MTLGREFGALHEGTPLSPDLVSKMMAELLQAEEGRSKKKKPTETQEGSQQLVAGQLSEKGRLAMAGAKAAKEAEKRLWAEKATAESASPRRPIVIPKHRRRRPSHRRRIHGPKFVQRTWHRGHGGIGVERLSQRAGGSGQEDGHGDGSR